MECFQILKEEQGRAVESAEVCTQLFNVMTEIHKHTYNPHLMQFYGNTSKPNSVNKNGLLFLDSSTFIYYRSTVLNLDEYLRS